MVTVSRANQITLKTQLSEAQATIRIQDNGIGMTDAVKPKIFEHLFATKGVGQGTGLGLALARHSILDFRFWILEATPRINSGA